MTMDEWKKAKESVKETIKENTTAQWLGDDDVVVESAPKINHHVVPENEGKPVEVLTPPSNFAKTALVLGIFSIVMGVFFAGAPWIGILSGIGAIVLGAVEKKKISKKEERKIANAGFVCGIVGTAVSVIMGIICSAIVTTIKILSFFFGWLF